LAATRIDPALPYRPAAKHLPGLEEGTDPLPAGVRTLGGYRLLRKLGEGGMGSVYLAYQEKADQKVALKILADGLAASQAYVDRFDREARSGQRLSHVNVVRNLAEGKDEKTGLHFLVLEYVDGPNGRELLERFGRLAVGDAVHIVLDVARALEHAHSRNVVHRDIKPDNILLTSSGVAKLADLGLAKRTDEVSHLTATKQGFGTPYYMPYEQAMNARKADGRSDVYALGATLYHLVTGEVPFSGNSQVEIIQKKDLGQFTPAGALNPAVNLTLDNILARMLARDPKERFQTASEVIVALERSGLAAEVPSFVDAELALQDPAVRQRLAEQASPTCLDVRVQPAEKDRTSPDIWFLRYRNQAGQWCKARATAAQVHKRLRDGRLPITAEAATDARGAFQPLDAFPEHREVLAEVANAGKLSKKGRNASSPHRENSAEKPRWWLLFGALALSLVALGAVVFCKVFAGPWRAP
jgi:serine/threonine-protein kinase